MAKLTYWQKLKDPRWQKKRLEVMQAKDFTCEMCGDSESTLNVHHKEYFKDLEPWEYENNQLAVLCEDCHETRHNELDLLKWVCSQADLDGPNSREEIAFFLGGFMGIPYDGMLSIWCKKDYPWLQILYKSGYEACKSSDSHLHGFNKESEIG